MDLFCPFPFIDELGASKECFDLKKKLVFTEGYAQ